MVATDTDFKITFNNTNKNTNEYTDGIPQNINNKQFVSSHVGMEDANASAHSMKYMRKK